MDIGDNLSVIAKFQHTYQLVRRRSAKQSLAAFLNAGCKQAEAQSNLAIALLLRLDSSAAAETLKTSLSLDPGNPRAISALQQLTAVEQQSFSDGVTRSGYATMD
ncbi:MAG UNVERIFIED_CONTAM: hypothetical protein LVR18_10295 [Planctomycetaceae bacterium]